MQPDAETDTTVLFLETVTSDIDGMRGGALLTDLQTEPLEFRLTDVVTPNRLQKTLWGSRLRGHLTVEIIGKPLFAAFKSCPSLIVVKQFELLELREFSGVAQVLLVNTSEDGLYPAYVSERRQLPVEGLGSLTIAVHKQFPQDLDISERMIRHLSQFCSVLDPFQRISTGLAIIEEQEVRARSSSSSDSVRTSS